MYCSISINQYYVKKYSRCNLENASNEIVDLAYIGTEGMILIVNTKWTNVGNAGIRPVVINAIFMKRQLLFEK